MDRLIRGTGQNHQVRVIGAVTTDLVNEAVNNHKSTPVVSAALGRLLTGTLLMSTTMKNEKDMLTIQVKGDGPIGGMLVTANSSGQVKGYAVNPLVDIPPKANGKLDVSGAVGKGLLQVIKDIGLKEAYTGQIQLVSGEIAEDLTHYYFHSEQTPSIVALGVLVDKDYTVKQAGGVMIQLLPNAKEHVIATLEKNMVDMPSITDLMEEGLTIEAIIERFLEGLTFDKMDEMEPSFLCDCNKSRFEKKLMGLGLDDINEIIADGETIETTCYFCNKNYYFTIEEMEAIKKEIV